MLRQMGFENMAGKSSQPGPEMFNDLLSFNLRGGAVMKNIYSG